MLTNSTYVGSITLATCTIELVSLATVGVSVLQVIAEVPHRYAATRIPRLKLQVVSCSAGVVH